MSSFAEEKARLSGDDISVSLTTERRRGKCDSCPGIA